MAKDKQIINVEVPIELYELIKIKAEEDFRSIRLWIVLTLAKEVDYDVRKKVSVARVEEYPDLEDVT